MIPFESIGYGFLSTVVTYTLSFVTSEIKRDIGRQLRFFSYPLAFNAPVMGSPLEYRHVAFGMKK